MCAKILLIGMVAIATLFFTLPMMLQHKERKMALQFGWLGGLVIHLRT